MFVATPKELARAHENQAGKYREAKKMQRRKKDAKKMQRRKKKDAKKTKPGNTFKTRRHKFVSKNVAAEDCCSVDVIYADIEKQEAEQEASSWAYYDAYLDGTLPEQKEAEEKAEQKARDEDEREATAWSTCAFDEYEDAKRKAMYEAEEATAWAFVRSEPIWPLSGYPKWAFSGDPQKAEQEAADWDYDCRSYLDGLGE